MRKTILGGGISALALAALVAGAVAAQRHGTPADPAGAGAPGGGALAPRLSAKDLIGRDVVDRDGDRIAEVADLIVEPDDTVRRAVVDVGGFLGVGARPVALDLDLLRTDGSGGRGGGGEVRTGLTRDRLLALPRQERDREGRYPAHPGD